MISSLVLFVIVFGIFTVGLLLFVCLVSSNTEYKAQCPSCDAEVFLEHTYTTKRLKVRRYEGQCWRCHLWFDKLG